MERESNDITYTVAFLIRNIWKNNNIVHLFSSETTAVILDGGYLELQPTIDFCTSGDFQNQKSAWIHGHFGIHQEPENPNWLANLLKEFDKDDKKNPFIGRIICVKACPIPSNQYQTFLITDILKITKETDLLSPDNLQNLNFIQPE